MHIISLLPFTALGLCAAVAPSTLKTSPRHRDQGVPLNLLSRRMACGETAPQVCYGVSGGTS